MSEHGFLDGSKRWKCRCPVDSHLRTQLTKQLSQSSSKGNFFVRVRFRGVPSTVEEVRVLFCCLLSWKTNTGNTGRTVLGHCHNPGPYAQHCQHLVVNVELCLCLRHPGRVRDRLLALDQSNLSGDTLSIEAPQNLLRAKRIFQEHFLWQGISL